MSGGGFGPDELTMTFYRGCWTSVACNGSETVPLGTTQAGPDGRFTATVRIPLTAEPGTNRIVVSGRNPAGGRHLAIAYVNVLVPTPPTTRPTLPTTGGDSAG